MISPGSTHQKSSKLEKNCDTHIVWQAVCVEDESRFVTDVTFLSIFNTFAKEALCLIRFLHSTNFLSFLSINIWVFPRAFRSCCVFFEYSPVFSDIVVFLLFLFRRSRAQWSFHWPNGCKWWMNYNFCWGVVHEKVWMLRWFNHTIT